MYLSSIPRDGHVEADGLVDVSMDMLGKYHSFILNPSYGMRTNVIDVSQQEAQVFINGRLPVSVSRNAGLCTLEGRLVGYM